MSDDELERVLGEIESELKEMSSSRQRSIARSDESAAKWVHNRMYTIGQALGIAVTLPLRAVVALAQGLFSFFGDD